MDSNKPAGNVFDVSKPGQTPANPTSKPIITHHGPMAKDPMFQATKAMTPEEYNQQEKIYNVAGRNKTVAPINPQVVPAKAESSENAEQPKVESTDSVTDAGTEAAKQNAEASSAAADKKSENTPKPVEMSEEERLRKEALQKMIEAKTYFLPIGRGTKGRNSQKMMVVLIAVAAVVFVMLFILIQKAKG